MPGFSKLLRLVEDLASKTGAGMPTDNLLVYCFHANTEHVTEMCFVFPLKFFSNIDWQLLSRKASERLFYVTFCYHWCHNEHDKT